MHNTIIWARVILNFPHERLIKCNKCFFNRTGKRSKILPEMRGVSPLFSDFRPGCIYISVDPIIFTHYGRGRRGAYVNPIGVNSKQMFIHIGAKNEKLKKII